MQKIGGRLMNSKYIRWVTGSICVVFGFCLGANVLAQESGTDIASLLELMEKSEQAQPKAPQAATTPEKEKKTEKPTTETQPATETRSEPASGTQGDEGLAVDIPEEEDGDVMLLDEIIVSGQRKANRESISERMNNDALVDAIGGDEMGKLPDANLGEALGRLPGVSTVEDEGVGRYATVRGLKPEYVNVTMDGMGLSAQVRPWDADSGRAANLQAISPDVISKVQVFKTITPDMSGNSIAGTINLQTRSAYDKIGTHIGLQGAVGQVQNEEVPLIDPDASTKLMGIYSTTFGKDDQFGIVLNGSYREVNRLIIKEDNHFGWDEPEVPAFPTSRFDSFTDETARKAGAFGKLEYKPREDFYIYGAVNYFDEIEEWTEYEHSLYNSGSYDESTSTFNDFSGLADGRDAEFGTDDALTYSAGMDWYLTDTGKLGAKGSYSTSEFYLDDQRGQWVSWMGLGGDYNANGRKWDLNLDAPSQDQFGDTNSYNFNEYRNRQQVTSKDISSIQIDWGQNAEPGNMGWGYKLGSKLGNMTLEHKESYFKGKKPYFDVQKYNGDLVPTDYVGSLGEPLIFARMDGVLRDVGATGLDAYKDQFKKHNINETNAKDYNTDESIYATYLMGRYANERFSSAFGVRYEYTDWYGESRYNQENDAAFYGRGGHYDHWLPSINASYRIDDNWALRCGYYMGVTRPESKNLVATESAVDTDKVGDYYQYRSNTDLQAREGQNFDAAVEYYFDGGYSMMSAGVFFKDIENEIYDLTFVEQQLNGGTNIDVSVTQPQNAGTTQILGLEVSILVDSFKFLPGFLDGFGCQANYTLIEGSMELLDENGDVFRTLDQLHHQSDHSANFVLFYEHSRFSARLAAKYMTSQIYKLDEDPLMDTNQSDLLRFDFHSEVKLWRGASAFLDIWNLTEESTDYYGGEYDETVKYGRTIWLGLNQNF